MVLIIYIKKLYYKIRLYLVIQFGNTNILLYRND